MKKKKLLIIIGAVAVVVILVVANLAMNTSNATKVQAEVVKTRELVEKVTASGRIQPQTKVDITSEINGEIIRLLVKEGDYVNTGDMLVVLDTVQLRTEVDQARFAVGEINARLSGAKTGLEQAEEEYQRQEQLYAGNLTSETQYKNAKYAYLSAKATHEATLAQSQQFQSRYEKQLDYLRKTKIVAPMPGVITYLDCEVGEIAAAQTSFTQGRTLMTISDLSVFEVEVEVDETEIAKVRLGQIVDIEVDALPDTTLDGKVIEIGNTAILQGLGTQDQSTNFRVKIVFAEPHRDIRPGMSADVDITTDRKETVLTVSFAAVIMRSFDADSLERSRMQEPIEEEESGSSTELRAEEISTPADTAENDEEIEREEFKGVFVVRDGVARFAEVTTGIADQKNIEIISGLEKGDSVISGPYRVLRTIRDGDNVEAEAKRFGDRRE